MLYRIGHLILFPLRVIQAWLEMQWEFIDLEEHYSVGSGAFINGCKIAKHRYKGKVRSQWGRVWKRK